MNKLKRLYGNSTIAGLIAKILRVLRISGVRPVYQSQQYMLQLAVTHNSVRLRGLVEQLFLDASHSFPNYAATLRTNDIIRECPVAPCDA